MDCERIQKCSFKSWLRSRDHQGIIVVLLNLYQISTGCSLGLDYFNASSPIPKE
ncbi:hypothetical protein DICVIV_09682 [Dictyocaulus viviparus]|uniref:Uncharacterized protein n=1 Tax=Dictyocaulus viviparus TaxID=29172 RepID=A0A0D8XI09_DICVI|nr:hypothetical protein DICVIV_09682 [Dictyocaulus viviparus]